MKRNRVIKNGKEILSVAVADNYFLRLRGLIGHSAKEIGGLLIKPCNQIHTCFMSEDIDVVYLSKDNVVVKIDTAVPNSKFCPMVKKARYVLELPAEKANELNISINDKLEFQI